jgi:hypothetical protein
LCYNATMYGRLRRWSLAILGLLLFFPGPFTIGTAAQAAVRLNLSPPDLSAFPQVATYLDARNIQGDFIYGLNTGDLTVVEDKQPLPIGQLDQLHPGVQLVVAINPGPTFAVRDSRGSTRYDHIVQALGAWVEVRSGSTLDDLSLLANGRAAIAHISDVRAWAADLQAYQPEARTAVPSFDLLGTALETAADPAARPGMGRAVLFITALPDQDAEIGLQSLAARAYQQGIRVFVWLVASADQVTLPVATELRNLATQTSGTFFAFTGSEPVPDLEGYLEPLRNTYALQYVSHVAASGTHQLVVDLHTADGETTSPPVDFVVDVSPPNVAFVSPPLEVKRTFTSNDAGQLEPAPLSQPLDVMIEFPDGHPRPLTRTTLYIDGVDAAVNLSPPYDHFTWEIDAGLASGKHLLKVEVVDSLGLVANSIDTPVTLIDERPSQDILATISRNQVWLAGAAVLLAGAVLLLVLVLGGQLHPGMVRERRQARRRSDPVTQPVPVKGETTSAHMPGWINRLHWPQRRIVPSAFAYLISLSDSDQESEQAPIPVTSDEVTFGRDPTLATQLLTDASVEPLHARLKRLEDGSFRLADEGSTAGSWINYTPVSQEGSRLEHGDLIHIGRVGFRFVLREPDRLRKPVVTTEMPQQ